MKKDNLLTVVYMTCNLILPDMHNFYYIGYCQVKQIHSKQLVTSFIFLRLYRSGSMIAH